MIERKGQRIVIRREPKSESVPDYSQMIRAKEAGQADSWSWEWAGPESELQVRDRSRS
ncbi:MAG: hypothetical protein ACRENP_00860 [Longimicrobiales bacterium]